MTMAAKNCLTKSAFVVLLASAFEVSAMTVTVKMAGVSKGPLEVTTNLRRVDGDMLARELRLPVGTATSVDVGDTGTWEITTNSNGFWSAPVYASGADVVTLPLWPRGWISGKLGSRTPPSGQLVVKFAPPEQSDQREPAGTVLCAFVDRQWSCELPAAGSLDLRFTLTGFATEFRWGVRVDGGTPASIGILDFTPGSSVSGKVQLRIDQRDTQSNIQSNSQSKGQSSLMKATAVSLSPVNLDPANDRVRRYTATPDARGFFQVQGLAPGEYVVVARADEYISDSRTVQIIANTNASLKQPLILARPKRVSIQLTPPLDTEQQRWQVVLIRMSPGVRQSAEILDRSLASETGAWSMNHLVPGQYRLNVQRQDGSNWRSEDFTLGSEDEQKTFDFVVNGEQVAGRVTLGDRPVAAKIQFGGENDPGLVADESGRFQGSIPPLKDESVRLLITSRTPDIRRTVVMKSERSPDGDLYFDIVLPATAIIGRVIHEDGSPAPHAIVTLQSNSDSDFFEQMFVNDDGTFQFSGFESGVYRLQAEGSQNSSAVMEVEARSDRLASTDLVLRAQEEVRGRVTMKGIPIGGATIAALPRGVQTTILPTATSDASGLFLLKLPPGTKTYDAIVFPRGFYVTAARIERDPKAGIRVEVGQDGGALSVDAPAEESLLLKRAGGEYSLPWVVTEAGGVDTTENGRRRLTIPSLEAGQYSICGQALGCKSVYVPPFATASVKLDD
jgi:hypothetical protein